MLRRITMVWVVVALMAAVGGFGGTSRVEAQTVCVGAIDIMLVLDGSGSIAPSDFDLMRAFSKQLVDSFTVDAQNVRIGIVQFDNGAVLELGLSDDATAIKGRLDSIDQLRGLTDIAAGLNAGQNELNANGRRGIPRAIILLTDGFSERAPAVAAADRAKRAGTTIFSIGVGSGVDFGLLTAIASDPNYVFSSNDFSDLQQLIGSLVSTTCSAVTGRSTRERPQGDPAFVTVVQSSAPNMTAGRNGVVTFTIVATNRGKGSAKNTVISMALDPAKLRVVDAAFSREGAWVSKLGETQVEIQTGPLGSGGDVVTATLRLAVQGAVADGTSLAERLTYRWGDDRSGGKGSSNLLMVRAGSSNNNQPYYPLEVGPASGPAGTAFVFSSTLFAPNEPVSYWYNTPAGGVQGLNTLVADGDGALVGEFDSTGLAPGAYSMVARGAWTGYTLTAPFTVQ